MEESKIILASSSQARRRMLEAVGLNFQCAPSDLNEEKMIQELLLDRMEVERIAPALARAKALKVSKHNPGMYVIGADQTLDLDGKILSKANSTIDAKNKLKYLRGKTHRLISAACVVFDKNIMWEGNDSASLTMINFNNVFLDDYCIKAGEALTRSVGAYEIEGEGTKLFSAISGDINTIQGLPLLSLLDYLKRGV